MEHIEKEKLEKDQIKMGKNRDGGAVEKIPKDGVRHQIARAIWNQTPPSPLFQQPCSPHFFHFI